MVEITNWVELRGKVVVAKIVRGALETIDKNKEFIKLTLAVADGSGVTPARDSCLSSRGAAHR